METKMLTSVKFLNPALPSSTTSVIKKNKNSSITLTEPNHLNSAMVVFSSPCSEPQPSITAFFYTTSQSYPEKIQYVPLHPNHQPPIPDPPSSLGFLDDPAVLHDSCNGLLHWRVSPKQHFISNPLIGNSVPITWPFYQHDVFASGIAFDPSVSDQFKVVVLVSVSSFASVTSTVFSSKTMNWGLEKETSISNASIAPYCPNRGIFIHGVLYWELRNSTLLAYNVNDRTDWLIELPLVNTLCNKLGFDQPGCLGESNGRLHYCRLIGTLLVVVAQGFLSSWVVLHMVELSGVIMCGSPSIKPRGPQSLVFIDDCKGVLVSVKNKIKAYYLQDGSVKEVYEVPRNGYRLDCVQPSMFFPYVHTLALLDFCSV